MNFTDEEIRLVEAHRAKAAKAEEAAVKAKALAETLEAKRLAAQEAAQEQARRQQVIVKTIADLLDQAKQLLIDAKQVAVDNGMQYQIEGLVTDMINEVSDGQYWYGSDQSHC